MAQIENFSRLEHGEVGLHIRMQATSPHCFGGSNIALEAQLDPLERRVASVACVAPQATNNPCGTDRDVDARLCNARGREAEKRRSNARPNGRASPLGVHPAGAHCASGVKVDSVAT